MSEQEQKRIFKNNLNILLEECGKTQAEVAKAIGVSHQTFNTWTRGKAIPRMEKIQKLADYFMVQKAALVDTEYVKAEPDSDNDILMVVERMKTDRQFRRLVCYALAFEPGRIELLNGLIGEMKNNEGDET